MNARRATRLLLLGAAALLATVALGAPRFTWANDGVVIDHPPAQAASALAAAAALLGAALGLRRAVTVAAGLGAILLAALAAERLAFRVEAVAGGVQARSLGRSAHLAWSQIAAVEPRADRLVLQGADGTRIAIATTRFAPDERIRLERTIARRVLETSR